MNDDHDRVTTNVRLRATEGTQHQCAYVYVSKLMIENKNLQFFFFFSSRTKKSHYYC